MIKLESNLAIISVWIFEGIFSYRILHHNCVQGDSPPLILMPRRIIKRSITVLIKTGNNYLCVPDTVLSALSVIPFFNNSIYYFCFKDKSK